MTKPAPPPHIQQPPMGSNMAVVIVNWNAGDWLLRCLTCVMAQTRQATEVIVFDNASSDGSVQKAIAMFPLVKVIQSDENLGFAIANNRAVDAISVACEWVLFLNPDAFAAPDCFEHLLQATQLHSKGTAFAARLMDAQSPDLLDGAGDVYHASGLAWRHGHGRQMQLADRQARTIFSSCAACALYKKSVFLEEGGFDEDFFCYLEDVDLGFRFLLRGHPTWYVPEAVAHHMGSALTGQRSDFSVYHGHRNLVWTYIKNMPGLLFWVFLPWHLVMTLVVIIQCVVRGQSSIILRAKMDACKGIPSMWAKRRTVQQRRMASWLTVWRMLDKRLVPLKR